MAKRMCGICLRGIKGSESRQMETTNERGYRNGIELCPECWASFHIWAQSRQRSATEAEIAKGVQE